MTQLFQGSGPHQCQTPPCLPLCLFPLGQKSDQNRRAHDSEQGVLLNVHPSWRKMVDSVMIHALVKISLFQTKHFYHSHGCIFCIQYVRSQGINVYIYFFFFPLVVSIQPIVY